MHKKYQGLTLIETLVSLLILAVMALIVFTNIATRTKNNDKLLYMNTLDRHNRYEMLRAVSRDLIKDKAIYGDQVNISISNHYNDVGFTVGGSYAVNLNDYDITFSNTQFRVNQDTDYIPKYEVNTVYDKNVTHKQELPIIRLADFNILNGFTIRISTDANLKTKLQFDYPTNADSYRIYKSGSTNDKAFTLFNQEDENIKLQSLNRLNATSSVFTEEFKQDCRWRKNEN